jgi:putative copper resistance protein D
MLAAAVLVFRFVQYFGATILLGSSLFFINGLPKQGPCAASSNHWPKRLLIGSAALLLISSILGLVAQTGLLAGSFGEGLKLINLEAVVTQMNFGWSNIIRAIVAAGLLTSLIVFRPSPLLWVECAIGGAVVCASFAWMGHGAATEGSAGLVHLLADIAHSVAAAVWVGALIVFVFLLLRYQSSLDEDEALYDSLRRFSGIGSTAVAVLIITGLVNSWFLVGINRLGDFWATLYGQVLLAKLALFLGMLGLAASNRYRLTPALGVALQAGTPRLNVLSSLRRSLVLETTAGLVVLGLVAWLGTLAPVTAQ